MNTDESYLRLFALSAVLHQNWQSSWHGDQFQDFVEHRVFGDAGGLGFVAQDKAVPQAGVGHGLDVGRRRGVPAVEPGLGSARAVEREGAARAGAHFDPLREL